MRHVHVCVCPSALGLLIQPCPVWLAFLLSREDVLCFYGHFPHFILRTEHGRFRYGRMLDIYDKQKQIAQGSMDDVAYCGLGVRLEWRARNLAD